MIALYDNFLSLEQIDILHNICSNQEFTITGKSRGVPNNEYQNRDVNLIKIINKNDKEFIFFKKIEDEISKIMGTEYSSSRSYINAFKFSDASLSHIDYSPLNVKSKTALLYCNREWNIDWGGETVFLNELSKNSEIIKSIIPKPGRLVIFDSEIPHAARVPNILYPTYRYTLVHNFHKII